MSTWCAKKLADEVASQMQLQVGQAYETNVILPKLNRVYEEIWHYTDWSSLVVVDTATIASGTSILVLPKKYDKLIYSLPTSDNGSTASYDTLERQLVSVLRMGRIRWLQEYDPAYGATFIGEQAVLVQPTSANAPKVVSSSASDVTQKVHIEGRLSGEMVQATITLTGTSAVASSVQFDEITSIAKSGTTAGTITVTSNAGTTTYATMASWETSPFYSAYKLDTAVTPATSINIIAHKRFVPFLHYMSVPFMDKLSGPLIDGTVDLCMSEMRQQDYAGYYRQRMMQRLIAIANEQTEPMEAPNGRA